MPPTYSSHLKSANDLVTPYKATRAGFISIALEKNRKATPFVEEAKALKTRAARCSSPSELLDVSEIRASLLTASGISDKAAGHLEEDDKKEAMRGLIENFLDPAGCHFVDELVYRFLLTRGDTLGGMMRNLAGSIGEQKFSRAVLSVLKVEGRSYHWLHSKSKKWIPQSDDDAGIETCLKGIAWETQSQPRTLIYNLTVPLVKKNVDLCLLAAPFADIAKSKASIIKDNPLYLALGELKGGIDPAGADEHWKTANSALGRIRTAFSGESLSPATFFVGAAIEKAMSGEIYNQLLNSELNNAANLTNEDQLHSLCSWLVGV